MKKTLLSIALVSGLVAGLNGIAQAAAVDTIQFNTGYFVPDELSTYNSPYYRWANEDWDWTHNAIAGSFTTANLLISAWDVDFTGAFGYQGERDQIFAYDADSTSWLSLGYLDGNDNAWAYTSFVLDSALFDDIANGLQVKIDIDTLSEGWAVTLAKSVLSVDGGTPPPPAPGGEVPEPATMLLFGSGLAGLLAYRRRK